jgi:hypothetical protein
VSAVLLSGLATYWLPVAPGWLSWWVLQRREYVLSQARYFAPLAWGWRPC